MIWESKAETTGLFLGNDKPSMENQHDEQQSGMLLINISKKLSFYFSARKMTRLNQSVIPAMVRIYPSNCPYWIGEMDPMSTRGSHKNSLVNVFLNTYVQTPKMTNYGAFFEEDYSYQGITKENGLTRL